MASGGGVLSAYIFYHDHPQGGILALLTISVFLSGIFLRRFQKTRKMMPGGMMVIISLLIFLYSLTRYLR
jgi:uncharacterized membrane protein (UPF0136 family)